MNKCKECRKGKLEIIDVDDIGMTVECSLCKTTYWVEQDGLGDGGLAWAEAMAEQLEDEMF